MKKQKQTSGIQIKEDIEEKPTDLESKDLRIDEDKLNLEYKEKQGKFKVTLEIPGVKADDIRIQCNVKTLEIRIRRKGVKALSKKGALNKEADYQWIEEILELPSPVRPKKAKARIKKGLLKITLPKKNYLKFHSIELKS